MTILNTPPIKLTDIRDAYGQSGFPVVLTDYYRNGGIVDYVYSYLNQYYTTSGHETFCYYSAGPYQFWWDGVYYGTDYSSVSSGNFTMTLGSYVTGSYWTINGYYYYNAGVPFSGNITMLDFQGVSGNP